MAFRSAARATLLRWLAPRALDWPAVVLPALPRLAMPALLELPPARRVLVLAPHPDDESIGCGGTLAKYAASGASLCVAVLTDGSQGDRELRRMAHGSAARVAAEQRLVETRQREAQAAGRILGVGDMVFLGAPDGRLRGRDPGLLRRLMAIVAAFRPDLLLLPFFGDRHADHVAANESAMALYDHGALRQVDCCGYEVWTPVHANVVVDISTQSATKRRAIEQYASQTGQLDYAGAALGINRYRAVSAMTGGEFAEAFYMAPIARYRRLFQLLRA